MTSAAKVRVISGCSTKHPTHRRNVPYVFPEVEPQPQLSHGGVNLPPRRPRGNGDDHGPPHERRGPRDRLRRYRVGLAFALVSIAIFFVAVSGAFWIRAFFGSVDIQTGEPVAPWMPPPFPAILWVNTAVLLVSSVTIEFARRRVFREPEVTEEWLGLRPPSGSLLAWLGATLALGLAFLGGQTVAWFQLYAAGIFGAQHPGGSFFYLLTGAHAAHLCGGIVALVFAIVFAAAGRSLSSRQISTDVSAWYWHAMGAIWLYILVVLKVAS
jgi:cytochrome c oxidase subunit III